MNKRLTFDVEICKRCMKEYGVQLDEKIHGFTKRYIFTFCQDLKKKRDFYCFIFEKKLILRKGKYQFLQKEYGHKNNLWFNFLHVVPKKCKYFLEHLMKNDQ